MLDTKGRVAPRLPRRTGHLPVRHPLYLGLGDEREWRAARLPSHELRGQGNACVFFDDQPDIPSIDGKTRIQRDTLLIRRVLTLYKDTLFEHLEFTNYDVIDHELEIEENLGSTFDDISSRCAECGAWNVDGCCRR